MIQNDHYVSQTYLKAFTNKDELIVPYYKHGHVIIGKPKSTKAVCYEKNGDANSYFKNSRILDDFLKLFENNWANYVNALKEQKYNIDIKYGIAGYISYLKTCNPTAKRIGQFDSTETLQPYIDKIMVESAKDDPESYELYKEKKIICTIDPEYPHSRAIIDLVNITHKLYCSDWIILFNNTKIPFITSDNPSIFYYNNSLNKIAQTFVPLTPKIGVLISPNLSSEFPTLEEFKAFKHENDQFAEIKDEFVQILNELIVKSAEKIVIHSEAVEWLEVLVNNNKTWRIETTITNLPGRDGFLTIYRQQPVDTNCLTD